MNSPDPSAHTALTNGNGVHAPVPVHAPEYMAQYPVAGTPHGPHQGAADLRALLRAFRRRWFTSLSLGLIAGSAAATITWLVVPPDPYRAFSELRVKSFEPRVIFETSEQEARFDTYKQTHMRLVKGPLVLQAALRDSSIANLPTLRAVARDSGRENAAVEWLEENLEVRSPDTEFLQISLSGERPTDLASIVNSVTTAFLNEVVNKDHQRRVDRLTDLERIHRNVQNEVRDKLARVRELATDLEASSPEALTAREEIAFQIYADLKRELSKIHFEWLRAKVQLKAIEAGAGALDEVEVPAAIVEAHVIEHPRYKDAVAEKLRLQNLVERYERARIAADNPRLVEARQAAMEAENSLELVRQELQPEILSALKAEMLQQSEAGVVQLRENISFWEAEKVALEEEIERHRIEQQENTGHAFEFELLRKDIEQREAIAKTLADEISRLRIEVQEAEPRITPYRSAEVPHVRDFGKKQKLTGLAGLAGFALVAFGIVWLEHQSRRISCIDEVVGGLRLRVMGALPLMPRWVTHGGNGRFRRLGRDRWNGALTESVDSARTFLIRQATSNSVQVLMVASAMGNEGKTTVACHLASSMARAGRRTVLVDCDIRRPAVQDVFDLPVSPGLCEVLRGEADLGEVIRASGNEGLWVIPAGNINQLALQILAQDGLEPIFRELREEFDFVIADSSPVLPVSDSLLIAQSVDGVVITIRRDVSRMNKVAAACSRLSAMGVPLLGTVMIGVNENFYGRTYGYGYQPSDEKVEAFS